MKYVEIRQAFTDFFSQKQHSKVVSSSLIPHDDPTLMFTNAGMNQFKDVFLGTDQRDYSRAVTIQKCLRAGGKHNDLENVGFTARHHTFFEMMGNFSFGDYFKKEAIAFAWEFLTEVLQIPKERLYVTVFTTDDEAAEIWEKEIGVPKEKIFRFGEKDNFWRMGQTGPCGPCSEIFYDHRPDEPAIPIDQDEDRFVEIWNLVFMQFFEDENGNQTPLPKPSVDTGAGIERVAAALQGFKDNYQCDVFSPLIKKVCEKAGLKNDWQSLAKTPETLGAVKVVADHARAATFLIGEGVLPSNEGRGYVLRRIMRRAIRYARKLDEKISIYPEVCGVCIDTMALHYPELEKKRTTILSAVEAEEKRFLQTLDKGNDILLGQIDELKNKKESTIDGPTAFMLYDTYGFPFDLTQVIASEQGLKVDESGFYDSLEKAKQKARAARKSHSVTSDEKHLTEFSSAVKTKNGATDFSGYDASQLVSSAKIVGLSDGTKQVEALSGPGWAAFDRTSFYAEGGGQVGDHGKLLSLDNDSAIAEVNDCRKMNDIFLHAVEVTEGTLSLGQDYQMNVDTKSRQATANNHSATHLLNAALKKVLGDHVNQAGSLVNTDKLRFDFSHGQPLTPTEKKSVESLVNSQITQSTSVEPEVMAHQEAIDRGAVAMFGEKYGKEVRVISMGLDNDQSPFSMELCGGTHVQQTAEIGLFKIVSESGVAAGVRRIEAVTGPRAFDYLNQLADENLSLRQSLNVKSPKIDEPTIEKSLETRVEDLQKKI
ncbi:MAG: alanine--tRNA ligase, partial [Pseudomonadota bacterium]